MAALQREAIYVELFNRLAAAAGVVTASRRFRDIGQVGAEEQPALFLLVGDELPQQENGKPTKWRLSPHVFVYARTDDETAAPSSVLNPIVTAIEAALQSKPGDLPPGIGIPTSLGKLTDHCWITKVEMGEGLKDGQAVALIHLEILATGGQ